MAASGPASEGPPAPGPGGGLVDFAPAAGRLEGSSAPARTRARGAALTRSLDAGFVVEFVGLPGSGKSTLSHALAEELRRRGERVTEVTYDITHRAGARGRRAAKLRYFFRTLLRHPIWSLAIAAEVGRSRQRSPRDYASTVFHLLYLDALRTRLARLPGIHLFDQGVFNALGSVRFSARSDRSLAPLGERAFRSRPAGGLVVFVDVRPEIAVARMVGRDRVQSRLEAQLHTDAFPDLLARASSAVEETRAVALAHRRSGPGGLAVASLRNDEADDLEPKTAQLARLVLEARRDGLEAHLPSESQQVRDGVAGGSNSG